MAILGLLITVLSLATVYGKPYQPSQVWRVPCVGEIVTREIICGGGMFPGSIPNPDDITPINELPGPVVESARRTPQGNTPTNNNDGGKNNTLPAKTFSAGGRTIIRKPGDTVCEMGGYIAAVGLEESLCEKSCDKHFEMYQNYLIVYPPCKGLFLVSMCKHEW